MDEKTIPAQEGSKLDPENSNNDGATDPVEDGFDGETTQPGADNGENIESSINWKAQAAYLAAEIANMQKRFARDATDIRKYANEDVLKRLAPALDNLTLALKAADKAKGAGENSALFSNKLFASFLQGVEMTVKQFEKTLQASGVEFIKSVGETFDPALHEALGQSNNPDVEDNVITDEFERGFKLNGRVIRPAKVFVNQKNLRGEQ